MVGMHSNDPCVRAGFAGVISGKFSVRAWIAVADWSYLSYNISCPES